ncbi:MAG: hypothetical protein JJE13_01940 [Thermoleophilia bacterium]|nr:hypothetical protein [Thermoleophilia bacterium]
MATFAISRASKGIETTKVPVRVEPSRIWNALTEPDQIAQWFGWDASTLAEEIQFIFVDHSTADPENLRLNSKEDEVGGMYLEVAASDGNSVVRAVQPGEDAVEGSDPVEEGWIQFFHQLKRYVEEHDSDHRKTLHLTGAGSAREIAAAFEGRLPGDDWFSGTYTRVVATGDFGPGFGVFYTVAPLDSDAEENAALTLSTWGLSEKEFFEITSDWLGWWQGLVEGGEAVV